MPDQSLSCCVQYNTENPQSNSLNILKPNVSIFQMILSSFMWFGGGKLIWNLPETLAIHNTSQRVQFE